MKDSLKKAQDKYNKENSTFVSVKLNNNLDTDIINKLKTVPSKAGYIKELIRRDIEGDKA